jgi:hypothetical protein
MGRVGLRRDLVSTASRRRQPHAPHGSFHAPFADRPPTRLQSAQDARAAVAFLAGREKPLHVGAELPLGHDACAWGAMGVRVVPLPRDP